MQLDTSLVVHKELMNHLFVSNFMQQCVSIHKQVAKKLSMLT